MTRQVEVMACCFVKVFVVNISSVFSKSFMKGFVTLANVLLKTFLAFYQIDDVSSVAVVMLVDWDLVFS